MSFYEQAKKITEVDLAPKSQYLSSGSHHVQITGVETKNTQKGGEMLVIDFQNNDGQTGIMRLNIVNSSTKAVEISLQHFRSILTMIPLSFRDKFDVSEDPNSLMGASFYVFGKDSSYTNNMGEIKKSVDFAPDSHKAMELFNTTERDEFILISNNDAPIDKYDPFDEDVPF